MHQPVFIVIVRSGDGLGEEVGGVFFELEEAFHSLRRQRGYRIEKWIDEEMVNFYQEG